MNYLSGRMAIIHCSTFVTALLQEWVNTNYLTYLLTYLLSTFISVSK